MRVQGVARFESAGDVRTVSLVQGDDGLLEVRELREGPSAVAVYGESEHSLRVLFAPEAVPGLLAGHIGGKGRQGGNEKIAHGRSSMRTATALACASSPSRRAKRITSADTCRSASGV